MFMICEILGLFVKQLTVDDQYSLLNRDISMGPIETQLSKKRKTFCELLSAFLKSGLNFKHFKKRDDPCRLCFSEITDSE